MKVNWFKIDSGILRVDNLAELLAKYCNKYFLSFFLLYLKQGYGCKDCEKDYMGCKCNFCKNCKRYYCVCNFISDEHVKNFTLNWVYYNLSKFNIMRLIDDIEINFYNGEILRKLRNLINEN